eukprot:1143199-Pelagomonas_calceolata.AAC.1
MRRWRPYLVPKQSLDRAWTRLAVCLPCRSLAGLKWLRACIGLSWLLCPVMNVLHHVPYTGGSCVLAVPSKHFAYQPTVCSCRFLSIVTILQDVVLPGQELTKIWQAS